MRKTDRVLLLCVTAVILMTCETALAANHPIRSFEFGERGEKIATLYRFGLENDPRHIPAFCEALASDDVEVRKAAITQLVFTHDKSALESIIGAMTDPSTYVRRSAIASLERIGSPEGLPSLRAALMYLPPGTEANGAVNAQPLLRREEYFNRLAAALALYRLGSDEGAATVLAILRGVHDNPVLQMAINAALIMDLKAATPDFIAIAQRCQSFGEDSPGFHALRALRIMGDPSYRDDMLKLAKAKFRTPGGFVKIETLHLMVKYGDESVVPIFREYLETPEDWVEHDHLIVEGIRKFAPPDTAQLLVKGILTPFGVDPSTGDIQPRTASRIFQLAAMTVADTGDRSVLGDLKTLYGQYHTPVDHFPFRLYLAYAMAKLGDGFGLSELHTGLQHEDAAVRRIAAKLLGMLGDEHSTELLARALRTEPDRTTFDVMKAGLGQLGNLTPELAATAPPPGPPAPVDVYGKPRYLHVTFDDCNTIEAMERFVELMEELAQQDSRWVFTMYVAPLARYDFEYLTILLQRCFDRGCEIEDHTLHHNPEGQHINARTEDAVRLDIGGGANWLHGHIMGLDKMYRWKGGGGGFRRPGDPTLTREQVWELSREAYWGRDIPYGWVDRGSFKADLYAPPDHVASPSLATARSGGDLYCQYDADTVEESLSAYLASFDYWYFNRPDDVFLLSGHDFPNSPIPIRIGHDKHWAILSGFLREVLLNQRARYPQLYGVTALELTHITRQGLSPSDLLTRETHLQDSMDF